MAVSFRMAAALLAVALSTTYSEPCGYTFTATRIKANCSHRKWQSFNETLVFSNVTSLNLSNNNIRHVSENFFKGLTHLMEISVLNNVISNLDTNAFIDLLNVEMIDLSHNVLKSIAPETFTTNLRLTSLYLKSNLLVLPSSGPFLISNSLAVLNVGYNQIKGFVSKDTFTRIPRLQKLYLEGNSAITGFSSQTFTTLRNLTEVYFDDGKNDSCYNILVMNQLLSLLGDRLNQGTFSNRNCNIRQRSLNMTVPQVAAFDDKVIVFFAGVVAMFVCVMIMMCVVFVVINEKSRRQRRRDRCDAYELESHFRNQSNAAPAIEVPEQIPVEESVSDRDNGGYEIPSQQDMILNMPNAPERPDSTFLFGYMKVLHDINAEDESVLTTANNEDGFEWFVDGSYSTEAQETRIQLELSDLEVARGSQMHRTCNADVGIRPRPYPSRVLPAIPTSSNSYYESDSPGLSTLDSKDLIVPYASFSSDCSVNVNQTPGLRVDQPMKIMAESRLINYENTTSSYSTSSTASCKQAKQINKASSDENEIFSRQTRPISEETLDFNQFAHNRLLASQGVDSFYQENSDEDVTPVNVNLNMVVPPTTARTVGKAYKTDSLSSYMSEHSDAPLDESNVQSPPIPPRPNWQISKYPTFK